MGHDGTDVLLVEQLDSFRPDAPRHGMAPSVEEGVAQLGVTDPVEAQQVILLHFSCQYVCIAGCLARKRGTFRA